MTECPDNCRDCPYSTCWYIQDDEYEEEDILCCHLCGCIIGEEVGYGYEMAPGEHICAVCAGEGKCNT